MEFKVEGDVVVKVVTMIMENNNRNAEVAMKVLDKCCDIADKFINIAAASIRRYRCRRSSHRRNG